MTWLDKKYGRKRLLKLSTGMNLQEENQ